MLVPVAVLAVMPEAPSPTWPRTLGQGFCDDCVA
jgi:hypothetical protein